VQIAQTNLQLYNELREAGRSLDELTLVHRAYELLARLYAGYYQADEKPFVAHGVGTASILASLDQPAEIVAVGMLHNVYGNGDFGDGLGRRITPFRRRVVREAMGERIEALLYRFGSLRIGADTVVEMKRTLPERSDVEKGLLLVDLADHLEKYADLGILYFGDAGWIFEMTELLGPDLIDIAHQLGQPRMAEMLSRAFEEASSKIGEVPEELRASDGRQHLKLVIAMSCRLKPRLRLQIESKRLFYRIRDRLQVRTRMRRLRDVAGRRIRA
jgi:(p)ppGpp synthase/HD superfamily hydrolase